MAYTSGTGAGVVSFTASPPPVLVCTSLLHQPV